MEHDLTQLSLQLQSVDLDTIFIYIYIDQVKLKRGFENILQEVLIYQKLYGSNYKLKESSINLAISFLIRMKKNTFFL